MLNTISKYLAIFSILLLISCNESSEKVQNIPQEKKETQGILDAKFSPNEAEYALQDTNPVRETKKGIRVSAKELSVFFPKNILDLKMRPPSTGVSVGYTDWTTTSTVYVGKDKDYIEMRISDYGSIENFPDKEFLDKLPSEEGYTASQLSPPNGKGYMLWDKRVNSGVVNVLFHNRFNVYIDAYEIKKDSSFLVSLLYKINTNYMLKVLEQNSKK